MTVNDSSWKSELHITDHYTISIPSNILVLCNYLRSVTNNNEFSILCRGSWNKNIYELEPVYTIPHQTVTHTAVYFDDENALHECRAEGFNVVIHCHPFTSSSFSHSDATSINTNFDCSILYSEGAFTIAAISLKLNPETIIQIKPSLIKTHWISPDDRITLDLVNERIIPKRSTSNYRHDPTQPTLYVDQYGNCVEIPYNQLPSIAIYDDIEGAFIHPAYLKSMNTNAINNEEVHDTDDLLDDVE